MRQQNFNAFKFLIKNNKKAIIIFEHYHTQHIISGIKVGAIIIMEHSRHKKLFQWERSVPAARSFPS